MQPTQTVRYPWEWIARVQEGFARLAESPWALFLILCTVNTIARPYGGITHDTRLYSGQVLNRVESGSYADDLFFRYGSQDDYSLFSRLAAPLVGWLGLPTAFFLIYIASKSLLIWGMMRIVLTLIPNRTAAVVALVYSMAVGIHYGGHHILNVQETFVTPRMPACALVLIGLDLLLRGRPVWSLLTIMLAIALHPLMAFGGLLVWAGFLLWQCFGGKAFAGVVAGACALAAIVLTNPPLALRCFGNMDDAWRESILQTSDFNFPSEWTREDWTYLAFQVLLLGLAIFKFRSVDAVKTRFLIVLMLVTLAATVGAILAGNLPYALFLQGQPYRALWILAVVHIGLAFWLCLEWARQPSFVVQLASCGMLAYLCWVDALPVECALPVLLFPLVAFMMRGLEKEPHRAGWLIQSVQISLVLGALGWAAFKFVLLTSRWQQLLALYVEHRDLATVLLINLGPVVFIAGLSWLFVRRGPNASHQPAWLGGLAAGCLGMQMVFFAFPLTDYYREHCTRYRADLRALRDYLHEGRAESAPLPTVYCNLGYLDYVWLDLHAKCYFDWWPVGNFMFCREMAMEGKRRAHLAGPFELAHFRNTKTGAMDSGALVKSRMRFHRIDFDRSPIDEQDLARLCREPDLDYIVLDQRFEGLYATESGGLYLYDCRQIRASLGLSEPAPAAATGSD